MIFVNHLVVRKRIDTRSDLNDLAVAAGADTVIFCLKNEVDVIAAGADHHIITEIKRSAV